MFRNYSLELVLNDLDDLDEPTGCVILSDDVGSKMIQLDELGRAVLYLDDLWGLKYYQVMYKIV